jgi:hypothetical protein
MVKPPTITSANTPDDGDDGDDTNDINESDNRLIDSKPPVVMTPQQQLRTIVRGAYDIQMLRIQMGNRIVAQYKAKLGQNPGKSEKDLDKESTKILDQLRAEYKKLMDGVKKVRLATFKATPLISNFTEFSLLMNYLDLEESEKSHFKNLGQILLGFDVYNKFLEPIPGVGPAIAGVVISEIDIAKATYPSSLWQYAGLGVESDNRGTSRRKEHQKEIAYTNKEGKPDTRMGILFNPFLKTKLMGVLTGSFLKAGLSVKKQDERDENGKLVLKEDGTPKQVKVVDGNGNTVYNREKCSKYALCYLDYKHRLQNTPAWADKTKGHIHNASLRFMIKRFLVDLHIAWRGIAGLPVSTEYSEGKLGMRHGESK